jgi:hypothetical protein
MGAELAMVTDRSLFSRRCSGGHPPGGRLYPSGCISSSPPVTNNFGERVSRPGIYAGSMRATGGSKTGLLILYQVRAGPRIEAVASSYWCLRCPPRVS